MNLLDLNLIELENLLKENGFEKFRAKQIWDLIFKQGDWELKSQNNLPEKLINFIKEKTHIFPVKIKTEQKSKDGTIKWLVEVEGKKNVEMVYIPEERRNTLCISSQVGCTLNCKFCHTGTEIWKKNLSPAEIIGQVLLAKKQIGDFIKNSKTLTNIVFMGMGEPLLNYENVRKSCEILVDKNALDFSWKKITISTSGIVPNIIKMADEVKTSLAISFHAPNDELRTEIMPINKKYPIEMLLNACKNYIEKTKQMVTLEYVMLDGVNDSAEHAHELAQLTKRYKTKINLIPFNPWPGCEYKRTPMKKIKEFADIIENNNIGISIRKNRGNDILAACGQLQAAFQNGTVK
jgi:23S rRNA (adenine2503-C2)-methyltransferase